jgi:hypothetical protein
VIAESVPFEAGVVRTRCTDDPGVPDVPLEPDWDEPDDEHAARSPLAASTAAPAEAARRSGRMLLAVLMSILLAPSVGALL